jgi:hypothetical protein
MDRQRVERAGAALLDLSYRYYAGGQLFTTVDNIPRRQPFPYEFRGCWAYWYDALGRLEAWAPRSIREGDPGPCGAVPIGETPGVQSYGYDRYGNRMSVQPSRSTRFPAGSSTRSTDSAR